MGMSAAARAQCLCCDHADLVNKLVLAMTGYRLNANGREVATIWRDLALAENWPALYQRMGVDVAEGVTPEWLTKLMMRLFGKVLLGQPKSGLDFAIVLDSDINLEVVDKLPRITAPTLVIGGPTTHLRCRNDRQTAELIPNADLFVEGCGQAVVKQTKFFEDRF